MSTSFDVYPTTFNVPTYSALLEKANQLVNSRMKSLKNNSEFELNISLQNKNESIPVKLTDKFDIHEEYYIWVSTDRISGGFCIYQYNNDQMYKELWEDELRREQSQKYEKKIIKSIERPYHWSVVRYAGTDPFYNLSYGLFASALAELTEGIIFSDDNAWEYSRFPCLPSEFNTFYFNPEQTVDKEHRNWAVENINLLVNDFDGN
ncbi:hypothetical protein [Paenibacillus sp. BC26]|uniref:hypothetical protein n=1 Tax=Paenibacillus sp. BC26 TaxID=1881032 RepID=UPI0008F0E028|nr:hypothetical protein [Paenibacillus sp. BC26]SFS67661.1 hypothetical protein SAMN05428962_2096 [Paenibacillus sp. BC26]